MKFKYLNIIAASTLLNFSACNDTEFSGGTKKPVSKEITPGQGSDAEKGVKDKEAGNEHLSETGGSETKKLDLENHEVTEQENGNILEKFFGRTEVTVSSEVDIIFAVDTSGSMNSEKSFIEKHIAAFLTELNNSKKINHQVFMIGNNFNFPKLDPTKFSTINKSVGSTDALRKIKEFFDNPVTTNGLKLRTKATKELVIVTDDDARSYKSDEFKDYLISKKEELGKVHQNGFVWLPTSVGNSWCKKARTGDEYIKLAADKEYGGVLFDLCTEDWKILFEKLAKKIITSNAQLIFGLSKPLDSGQELSVKLNNEPIDQTNWIYDEEKNSIIFQGGFAPQDGDTISVEYTPIIKNN